MPEFNDLGLFIITGLLLNITPGVDLLYVVHRTGAQGLKAGLIASVGIFGGCLIHIFFAVVGLSAILAASSTAFILIKYVGAAYLIYLGIQLLINSGKTTSIKHTSKNQDYWIIFKQGVLINALNPKVALFFLAFIPQFIDSSSSQKPLLFLLLGLIFNVNGTLILMVTVLITVKLKSAISMNQRIACNFKKLLGFGFMALGAKLALDK